MKARGHLVRFLLSMQRCKTMKDAGLRRQRVDHGTASHLLSAVAYKRSRLQAQVTRAPGRVCALLGNIPQLRIASIKIFVMKHEFRPRCSPAWSAAGASKLAPRGATLRITLTSPGPLPANPVT